MVRSGGRAMLSGAAKDGRGRRIPVLRPAWRPEIEVVGLERPRFGDFYHRLLTMSWRRFVLLSVALYLGVNLVFGVLYWLQPGALIGARPGSFADAFFFSVQTLGTIGYGVLAPRTLYAHLLVTIEAFFSLAVTAVSTGMIFARISRPTARVVFSRCAVVTTINGQRALMFRAGNVRLNQILEGEVSLNLARRGQTTEGIRFLRFFELKPVRARSPLFALTWTIMHIIDEESPLHGATAESLIEERAEIIVVLSGVDETFAQRIHARYSYRAHEVIFGRRFVDIMTETEDGRRIIDYARFHDLHPVEEMESA